MNAMSFCGLIALTLAAVLENALADGARGTSTPAVGAPVNLPPNLTPSAGPSWQAARGGPSPGSSVERPPSFVPRVRDSGGQRSSAPVVSPRDGNDRPRWLATPANRIVDVSAQAGPPVFRTIPERVDRKTPPPVHNRDGGSRTHHRHHGHDGNVIVVFNWYTWPPYCYTSDVGTDVYYGAPPSGSSYSTDTNYYDYGYGWAQGLRDGLVEWDEFVGYVRDYILDAAPESIAEFRRGFLVGYGINGAAAFDRAMDSASE